MKKILMIFLFLFVSTLLIAQINFTINGKIETHSTAKQINLGCSGGEFIAEIKPDGSFIIKGNVVSPGTGLIKTDSSGSDAIWLDSGTYNIVCKEITMEGIRGHLFRIPELEGPQDAEIFHGYMEPQFYIRGTIEEMRKKRKDFAVKYLDSVFNTVPGSKALPEILRFSRSSIGDEAAQLYMSMLNTEQVKDHNYMTLENYFKRKEKIEKEKYFQAFQMKDQNGKNFKLSSINKKLILLDFWSSDCVPCRRKHPRLAELYKKYADKGFEIISVSLDDNKKDWKNAIIKDNMVWINV